MLRVRYNTDNLVGYAIGDVLYKHQKREGVGVVGIRKPDMDEIYIEVPNITHALITVEGKTVLVPIVPQLIPNGVFWKEQSVTMIDSAPDITDAIEAAKVKKA